ncbi:hypothetical protein AMATHDRAFT_153840 [Amanita thiersii Skay4041]|uniref:AB hydrolase-1 domain-containing protein n=1 Tax=Amanita thiersii Skay4041 TaxID=703135 RepID=A0A2A9NGE8_9AGAR|nr:hypothetical protein AMATHDRAFT_153840 [Amanita thiersii Skay4041]
MPFIGIETSAGPATIAYAISTPTSTSADSVTPGIPTVVFLHSGYTSKETFLSQYEDATLRQFNLVAFDFRGLGETGGLVDYPAYSPKDTATDLYELIRLLKLPPFHVFGLSIGACVALEVASSHPELVLSLTLCSPLSPVELEDIAFGRQQIFEYWETFVKSTLDSSIKPDMDLFQDVVTGCTQLVFNVDHCPLTDGVTKLNEKYGAQNWAGSLENVQVCRKVCVDWFLNRGPLSDEQLRKISCPVSIIHCESDVAYPFEVAEELRDTLVGVGLKHVSLHQVPGPHYGCLTHPHKYVPFFFFFLILSLLY